MRYASHKKEEMLSSEKLKHLFSYDPTTGDFTRLVQKGIYPAGHIAGTVTTNGYVMLNIDGTLYLGHRLAWLYMTGRWPADQIDHIDHVKTNNKWTNLREVSGAQNQLNRPIVCTNASGFTGVSFDKRKGRWRAYISLDRAHYHLGYFDTPEAAHHAYEAKKRELHGDMGQSGAIGERVAS